MPWTEFMDMHSGGGLKEEDFAYIYIEAPIDEAKVIFYNRFGHNPDRVSCTCCGEDYSVTEWEDLLQATGFQRGASFDRPSNRWLDGGMGLIEYINKPTILVIPAKEIEDHERHGEVPEQGYIWRD